MSTINIRIDAKMKKEASKTLASLGMDTSTAVKMFLKQVIVEQALPFKPRRSPEEIVAEWEREIEESKKGPRYKTAEEAMRSLLE